MTVSYPESTTPTTWWRHIYQRLISAHPSIQAPAERAKAELQAALALAFALIVSIGLLFTLRFTQLNLLVIITFLFPLASFTAYLLSRTPQYRRAPLVFVGGFVALAYATVFLGLYPALFMALTFTILFLLANLFEFRQMVVFVALNTIAILVSSVVFLPQLRGQEALNVRAGVIAVGAFMLLFAWHRNTLERLRLQEVLNAQKALEQSNQELQQAQQQVNARLREIQLAAEVGRAVSQVRTLDVLLSEAVEIIRQQFDLYYVQVYLLNPAGTQLLLHAGTGEAGRQLLARRHRLHIDSTSINGRAALEKHPVVVAETAKSPTFKPNPLLPATRSEMAVPLLVAEEVIGVLDVQSETPESLNEAILPAFQGLAAQLAIAVQNARLLAEAQQARLDAERAARRLEQRSWQEYLNALHKPQRLVFTLENDQIQSISEPVAPSESALSVPIEVSGQSLGLLAVELPEQNRTSQAEELLKRVARQAAEHLETLRLLETTERYRAQAEEAARRLTREGWEEYFSTKAGQSLGYLYDLKEVKSIESETALSAEAALAIPIKVRDETIGKLAVLDVDSADPETLELVNTVSERLSEHIESLRLLEETQRGQIELNKRARQLAAVSQISTVSSRELDVQKMLATVVQMTQREFGLYHAHIFTYNQHANHLEIVACGWKEGDENEGSHETTVIPLDQEQSLVARAARTRQPVVVNDVHHEPGWLSNPLLPDTHSELAVPLVIGDDVLGVLDVQSDRVNAFSSEDINIQATLAAQVATALQNARSFARAQRQAEREAMLNAISQKIQSATSVEAVLQIAARELGHALGAPRTIAQLSMKDHN